MSSHLLKVKVNILVMASKSMYYVVPNYISTCLLVSLCFSWVILSQFPPQDSALGIPSVWILPTECPNFPYINGNSLAPTYSAHHSYHSYCFDIPHTTYYLVICYILHTVFLTFYFSTNYPPQPTLKI